MRVKSKENLSQGQMIASELKKLSWKSKLVLQKSVGGYLEIRTSECPDFNNQEDVRKYWIFDLWANKKGKLWWKNNFDTEAMLKSHCTHICSFQWNQLFWTCN